MRQMSMAALQSALAQETGEVWLIALRLIHADWAEPMRFVNNTEPMVRSDGTYFPFPFDLSLPEEGGDAVPTVQLVIDNVDRQITDAIRDLTGRPDVEFDLVLASSPDIVEAGPFKFAVLSIQYDKMTVQATLGYEDDMLNNVFPSGHFTPSNSPGLFV